MITTGIVLQTRAPRCDLAECVLPDCFCSADGTVIPGAADASVEQTPQMVTLSFNGAVTGWLNHL